MMVMEMVVWWLRGVADGAVWWCWVMEVRCGGSDGGRWLGAALWVMEDGGAVRLEVMESWLCGGEDGGTGAADLMGVMAETVRSGGSVGDDDGAG
ncbi:hypothetical protein F0562_005879 [Nyssa sinensis]|uniref:Secreted protein n=1 Tax=Nyssa sinensis TaxID=561372 RepID=A0A5J5AP82_9ASTE|nr:hypothetical protein F0562_005879 [Nyssa sinensis]